jgi:hypothetical protein
MTSQFGGVVSRLPKNQVLPHHRQLQKMAARATAAMSPILFEFQEFLTSLAGTDLGNAAQKKAFVDEIQLMLDLLNCRCLCPNCGALASLGFRVAGAKKEERFEFNHAKRGFSAGACTTTTRFPKLVLGPLVSPLRHSTPYPSH